MIGGTIILLWPSCGGVFNGLKKNWKKMKNRKEEATKVEKIVKVLLTFPLQIGIGLVKCLHNSAFIEIRWH